jgi:hypothetical protein
MAFLDDARQLAEQASRQIEQGIEQVRERIDELQQQRRFGQLARDLGLMVYRSRRGGAPLDELEVERITAEMAAIEASAPTSSGDDWPGGRQGPGPAGPGGERPRTTGPGADEGGQDKPPAPPGGYTLDDV